MSLTADSPAHSSSSDDLAAFLDAELETASGTSSELEDVEAGVEEGEEEGKDDEQYEDENEDWGEDGDGKDDSDATRIKRSRVAIDECTGDTESSKSRGEPAETSGVSVKMNMCTHPGVIGGMCILCGQLVDDESGVSFGYIHKNLRLTYDEIARLREKDLKNLLQHKKIYLVLDLDHTLLNSTRISDISTEEEYLKDTLPDALKSSLFRLDRIHMMTKLRPFVNNFLKEASDLFEMYIYTMGERPYALEMAKLLDPRDVYFHSRVIAQGDSTQRHQKGLDIVLGQESSVLILDDTEVNIASSLSLPSLSRLSFTTTPGLPTGGSQERLRPSTLHHRRLSNQRRRKQPTISSPAFIPLRDTRQSHREVPSDAAAATASGRPPPTVDGSNRAAGSSNVLLPSSSPLSLVTAAAEFDNVIPDDVNQRNRATGALPYFSAVPGDGQAQRGIPFR